MNEHDKAWVQWLPMIMAQKYSLQVHTLSLTNDVYTHDEGKCPRCQAEWLLERAGYTH